MTAGRYRESNAVSFVFLYYRELSCRIILQTSDSSLTVDTSHKTGKKNSVCAGGIVEIVVSIL